MNTRYQPSTGSDADGNPSWTTANPGVATFLTPHTVFLNEAGKSVPYNVAANPTPAAIKQPKLPAAGIREQSGAMNPPRGITGRHWVRGSSIAIFSSFTADYLKIAKDDYPVWRTGAQNIRCVTDRQPSWFTPDYHPGDDAHIIYLAADGQSLQLGRWGDQITSTSQIVLFMFGGLTGISNVADDEWSIDGSDVVFNPTAIDIVALVGRSIAEMTAKLPKYNSVHGNGNGWNRSRFDSPSISNSGLYHTMTNIKAGKGDPCRIAGLTKAQIQSATTVEKLDELQRAAPGMEGKNWRTPTAKEGVLFGGDPNAASWNMSIDPYAVNNIYGYWTWGTSTTIMTAPGLASFPVRPTTYQTVAKSQKIPAMGLRGHDGFQYNTGMSGHFSSSQSASAISKYGFDFYAGQRYYPCAYIGTTVGVYHAHRCVPM